MFAAQAGVMRQISALERSRNEAHYGAPEHPWDVNIEGCGAECAFAKYSGMYWQSVVKRPSDLRGDVGHVQVRSTPLSNGCMIVHEDDKDGSPFVLVVGKFPKYEVIGWMHGHEAKNKEFWRTDTGRPAFFVPQDRLWAMDSLPSECLESGLM
jgi:hypothetical protein